MDLSFSLLVRVDTPISNLVNTVTSQPGGIEAETCVGGEYIFGSICIFGTESLSIDQGTSSTVSVSSSTPFNQYGVYASYSGVLEDGTFSGLAMNTELTSGTESVPETSSWTVLLGGLTGLLGLAALRRGRRRNRAPSPNLHWTRNTAAANFLA
jgi:MYXO-CTERM domain-containing protein